MLEAWVTSVDADLSEAERRRVVARALSRLLPRDERVVRRFYWDGLSMTDIAAEMDLCPSRVRQLLGRAQRRLRKLTWPAARDLM